MKLSLSFVAFFFLVAVAVPVFSEQAPYRLEDIVVTASRIESPLREAPANVSVITSEDIAETGTQTIADVMQGEPGVFTQNLLGNNKNANIDIRGYGEAAPQNVLILVNGRRVNAIDLTGADLAQIPVDSIERIEIYRGPGTVLYGDNAAGGVVNIILKAGEGPPRIIASSTVGSYNYFKPEVVFSGSQGRFSYLTTLSSIETRGYRHNNEFYGKDALGNFGIDAFRNLRFNVSAGHHRDSYGLPGALFRSDLRGGIVDRRDSTLSYLDSRASTEDNFVDVEPQLNIGENVLLSLGGSYRKRHTSSSFDYGQGDFFRTKGQLQTYALTPKAVLSHSLGRIGKNVLIVGSDWYRYPTKAVSSTSFFNSPSRTRNDVEKRDSAYYLTDKFYPVEDLLIEMGYRRQRSTYDFENTDLLNSISETDMSSRYSREAYRLSTAYSIMSTLNIFAAYSKGFRFPATDEFISWGYYDSWSGTFVPTSVNKSLKPQATKEFDVGIRWNPWRSFSGAVTYFSIRNRDEIYYNPLEFSNQNYDRTRRWGIETSLHVNLAPGLFADLGYSYTDASFHDGPLDGNRIPLVPKNKVSVKVGYSIANWDFSVMSVYTGDRYAISDQENTREKLPGYTTFDTAVGYRMKALSTLLVAKNITGKKYSEVGTYSVFKNDIGLYPSPGRQFFLTLKYELGG